MQKRNNVNEQICEQLYFCDSLATCIISGSGEAAGTGGDAMRTVGRMLSVREFKIFYDITPNEYAGTHLVTIINGTCLQVMAILAPTLFCIWHYYSTIGFVLVLVTICIHSEDASTRKSFCVFVLNIFYNLVDVVAIAISSIPVVRSIL